MTQKLYQDKTKNLKEFHDCLEVIYSGTVNEIVKQIQGTCVDRSALLERVWQAYVGVVKLIIEKQMEKNLQLEKDGLKEVGRLHELYQKTLSERVIDRKIDFTQTGRMVRAEKDLKVYTDAVEKMQKENKYLRRKSKRLEQESGMLRGDCELLQLKYEDLLKENNTLKLFQEQSSVQRVGREIVDEDRPIEQLEKEFEEELYSAKREIFEDFKRIFEDQTQKMEEAYQRKKRELERNDDPLKNEEEFDQDIQQDILFKDMGVGTHITYQTKQVDTEGLFTYACMAVQTVQE